METEEMETERLVRNARYHNDIILSQRARIAELEGQLEAAVGDMKLSNTRKFNNPCEICRNLGKNCAPVDLQDVCRLWEWRGCKAEEGENK